MPDQLLRKTGNETFVTTFQRWANCFRAGIVSLGTAAQGTYKLARHRGSQGHQADLRQAFVSVRQCASSDRGSAATQHCHGAKSVRSAVEAMTVDRACFDALQGGRCSSGLDPAAAGNSLAPPMAPAPRR